MILLMKLGRRIRIHPAIYSQQLASPLIKALQSLRRGVSCFDLNQKVTVVDVDPTTMPTKRRTSLTHIMDRVSGLDNGKKYPGNKSIISVSETGFRYMYLLFHQCFEHTLLFVIRKHFPKILNVKLIDITISIYGIYCILYAAIFHIAVINFISDA